MFGRVNITQKKKGYVLMPIYVKLFTVVNLNVVTKIALELGMGFF